MPSSVGPRCTVTLVGGTSAILIVLFSDAKIASDRSKPTFLASTSNAATNFTSRTWYGPRRTCIRPGTVAVSSALAQTLCRYQLVEPLHFALAGLQAELMKLPGVPVD